MLRLIKSFIPVWTMGLVLSFSPAYAGDKSVDNLESFCSHGKANGLTSEEEKLYIKEATFLLNKKYCIDRIDFKNSSDDIEISKHFPEVGNVISIRNRYINSFLSIESHEDKFAFVDLFLKKYSINNPVSYDFIRENGQVTLGLLAKYESDNTATGEIINLFPSMMFNSEINKKYINHVTTLSMVDSNLAELVNYVITGKKKL
ncbi:hypothetical protein D5R81_10430 [Parashewanella spongiae]|uniref:Uncharacterized protein n=1 Tax=Parashewanella spongiae TaxID=342950 RepID=A0A3A6TGX1_9GAMM|nr:hypothetical protein [Parashewanella spongiae]MCL1079410.1 hypothetical protein [Parashewanella spongiae]RJY14972.1 hypothetical protein D5R81_10430 [Parashewanella spongiae]